MEKLLVTGAAGFLGSNVVWAAQEKYDVIGTSLNLIDVKEYTIEKLDITNRNACIRIIDKYKPDVIFHCSALTDLIACEEKPDLAEKVNIQGTRNLVDACEKVNARMIYVSTDWIFNGKKKVGEKYTEDDEPSPLNNYGLTKLKGENEVRQSKADWIIARPANIYGNSYNIPKDKSQWEDQLKRRGGWTISIIKSMKEGRKILQPTDLFQTPVLASSYVETALNLYEKGQQGIFHITGRTCTSRYEFVKEITKVFELDENLIEKGDTYTFAKSYGIDLKTSPIQFPQNTCLAVNKIEKTLNVKMLTIPQGLEIMKKQRGLYYFYLNKM